MAAEKSQTLNVLSGGAVKRGIAGAAEAFEKETGCKVNIQFATAPVMREKVEKNETGADVIVAPVPSMGKFGDQGKVVKGTPVIAGSVMAGVVVKEGAKVPDLTSAASLKQNILDAEGLVYNKASSGIYIEKMMENLGIADQVAAKTLRTPTGGGVMEHLIDSSSMNEIGFGQITEIIVFKGRGIQLVGPLPKELENLTTYAAGVLRDAEDADLAQKFVSFIKTPASRDAFEATGVTPPKDSIMEQRISLITLGVTDLARSTTFYEALGWTRSMKEAPGVSFFQTGGMAFGLYPRDKLAEDAGVASEGSGFSGIALAYNARTREDVDAVLNEAVAVGGTLVKAAEDVFWGGYSGYFADPDGHLWEVAWNPGFTITDDGAVILPD